MLAIGIPESQDIESIREGLISFNYQKERDSPTGFLSLTNRFPSKDCITDRTPPSSLSEVSFKRKHRLRDGGFNEGV